MNKNKNGNRFILFTSGLTAALLVAATLTADAARADQNEIWRLRHDQGNRFEGRRAVTVKRPDLELVSFVGFHEHYYAQDVDLKVRFFLSENTPFSIEAREIEERTQYRMEVKPYAARGVSWREWGPWPTGDVLRRENIPSSNLGVLVKLQEGEGRSLAPAFVYYSQPPRAVKTYSVYIRPNAPLRTANYSLHRRGGDEILRGETEVGDFAGEPFEILLDVSDVEDGFLKLEIQTQIQGRNKSAKREYEFFHKRELGNEAVQ